MNIAPIILNSGKVIGAGHPAYIIAEIGSNHDGELERAKKLIREAKKAGADAAKFQSFQVEKLINKKCLIDGSWVDDPSWEKLENLSIPNEWYEELQAQANDVGIDFLSTPFDLERLELLLQLDVPAIKIASGDLTYHELIKAAGKSGKPVFISSGHATLGEVEAALTHLWEEGCKDIVLLHCTSSYPADIEDVNISAMVSMQMGFQVQVGYSDHTLGTAAPLGAVALGAVVIEKHFTDDKKRSGPDHPFALDFDEFKNMTMQIRELEKTLISVPKAPRPKEIIERTMARRAVYAKVKIAKDTPITREAIKIVRHAYKEGIPADCLDRLLHKAVKVDIDPDQLITWEMIC